MRSTIDHSFGMLVDEDRKGVSMHERMTVWFEVPEKVAAVTLACLRLVCLKSAPGRRASRVFVVSVSVVGGERVAVRGHFMPRKPAKTEDQGLLPLGLTTTSRAI
eukprot:scaffold247657_cov33-Prasinocladus_malaysianus.AAC.2